MEYVTGSVIVGQRSYKRRLRSGKIKKHVKEKYKIIINEKNIFQNHDRIIIMKETDFKNLFKIKNNYDELKTENKNLKSVIHDFKNKIKIFEEYTKYLELKNKEQSELDKSNYFSQ